MTGHAGGPEHAHAGSDRARGRARARARGKGQGAGAGQGAHTPEGTGRGGGRQTHGMSVTSVPYTPMGRTSSSAVTWKSTGSSYLGVGECRACSRGAVAAGGGADTSARLCTAKVSCRHGRGSSKLAWYRYKLPKNYALNYYGNLLLEKDERRYTKVSARINSGRHECGKKHITSICRIWVLKAGIHMSCEEQ